MRRFFVMKFAAALIFVTVAAAGAADVEAEQALKMLMEGNKGFAKVGDVTTLTLNSSPTRRISLASGQAPFAIVLTCSDSRVPPEILFDRGLGEIFVIRVAGNIVAPHELGSIEYAVEHLGANLIMVLGHTGCGAVTATYNAIKDPAQYPAGTNIASIVDDIRFNIGNAVAEGETVEECIVENLEKVAESLPERSQILEEYLEGKLEADGEIRTIKIVKAEYDLNTGLVSILP